MNTHTPSGGSAFDLAMIASDGSAVIMFKNKLKSRLVCTEMTVASIGFSWVGPPVMMPVLAERERIECIKCIASSSSYTTVYVVISRQFIL